MHLGFHDHVPARPRRKIHVMHVIDSLAVGGAERMLVDLANNTDRDLFSISVCVTRSNMSLAEELNPGICRTSLKRRIRFDPNGFIKLARYSAKQQVDIYHAHSRSTVSFLLAAKKLGFIKAPVLFHDHYGVQFRQIPTWLKYFGSKNIQAYVGVCKDLEGWAKQAGIPADRIQVIENAIDFSRLSHFQTNLREELGLLPGQILGIMIGGVRYVKGFDLLIEVLAKVNLSPSTVIAVIGGTEDAYYQETCMAKLRAYGLEKNIRILGTRRDSAGLLASADFALLPSRSESGPLAIIEYMASGLPFVAFRVGGISKQAADAGIPEFVEPEDISSFSHAFRRLLSLSKTDMVKRGSIGREFACCHFDIRTKMNQWYELYEKLYAKRNGWSF